MPHTNDVLVLYSYHENKNSRENIKFFINHALHATSDFILILNGQSDIDEHPGFASKLDRKNIEIVKRTDTCFDMGAYGVILNHRDGELMKKYKYYIFIDSTARGPFVPSWSNACWTHFFTSKLSETLKLQSATMNCKVMKISKDDANDKEEELTGGFADSMIFATDSVGVKILSEKVFSQCPEAPDQNLYLESTISLEIWSAGYDENSLMTAFHSQQDYAKICNHWSLNRDNQYYDTNIHPFEVIFIKTGSGIRPNMVETFSRWAEEMKYSSYNFCVKGRAGENGWHRLMNWGKDWQLAPPVA